VKIEQWKLSEIKPYRIADNKRADLATWDLDLLPGELAALSAEDFDLTEKPVGLAVRAMQYSSRPGENVLDLVEREAWAAWERSQRVQESAGVVQDAPEKKSRSLTSDRSRGSLTAGGGRTCPTTSSIEIGVRGDQS